MRMMLGLGSAEIGGIGSPSRKAKMAQRMVVAVKRRAGGQHVIPFIGTELAKAPAPASLAHPAARLPSRGGGKGAGKTMLFTAYDSDPMKFIAPLFACLGFISVFSPTVCPAQ